MDYRQRRVDDDDWGWGCFVTLLRQLKVVD